MLDEYDYDAVVYDDDIYCIECLPAGKNPDDDDISPIFAGSEWEYYPCCCICGAEHYYVTKIDTM